MGGTIFLDEIGEIDKFTQVKILRVLQEKEFERVGGEKTLTVDVRILAATNRNLENETANGNFRQDLYYRLNVVNIAMPPLRERVEDIALLAAQFIKESAGRKRQGHTGHRAKSSDTASSLFLAGQYPGIPKHY